jgi:hypothetical protein
MGTRVAVRGGMRSIALFSLTALSTACGEPFFGDLTLYYEFDGLSCDAAGVDQIEVEADGMTYGDRWEDRFSCARFPDGISIEFLRADLYQVRIRGFSPAGVRLYDTELSLRCHGGMDRAFDVDVPFTTGDLTIFWSFDGTASCGAVDEVRVRLRDPFDRLYDDARYDCRSTGVLYEELQTGDWIVRLDGIDPYDRILFQSGSRMLTVLPDRSNEFDVELGVVP